MKTKKIKMSNINISKYINKYISNKLVFNTFINYNITQHNNKSIVIWRDCLHCTVKEKFSITKINMVKLPNYIKSIKIGILLLDGSIVFSDRNKNGRLNLTQSLNNSNYLYSVYNSLSDYCPRFPIL